MRTVERVLAVIGAITVVLFVAGVVALGIGWVRFSQNQAACERDGTHKYRIAYWTGEMWYSCHPNAEVMP